MRCLVQRVDGRLASWQLRDRAAELERPILLATARRERDNGTEERHDKDLLGTHDPTSNLQVIDADLREQTRRL
jgi:hypothetical protein